MECIRCLVGYLVGIIVFAAFLGSPMAARLGIVGREPNELPESVINGNERQQDGEG